MNNIEFEYPYVFILLLLIICIYKCPVSIKKIIFPHIHLFKTSTHLINIEKILYSLILSLLITTLSSPISYDAKISQDRKGRDLIFVLDSSGSMGESGYDSKNLSATKFNVLKKIISDFIQKRFDDNVGVTVFASYAFASVPLTYDMKAVAFLLDFLEVGIAGQNTAIGNGLANATELLKQAQAKSKVIILITDGYQNSGTTSIKVAVKQAKDAHIQIYTIGIGTANDFDAKLLQKIAKDTNAKMFQAQNAQELSEVYNILNSLEPSKIRSKHYLNKDMLFIYPLAFAILLLLYLLSRRGSKWSF